MTRWIEGRTTQWIEERTTQWIKERTTRWIKERTTRWVEERWLEEGVVRAGQDGRKREMKGEERDEVVVPGKERYDVIG